MWITPRSLDLSLAYEVGNLRDPRVGNIMTLDKVASGRAVATVLVSSRCSSNKKYRRTTDQENVCYYAAFLCHR